MSNIFNSFSWRNNGGECVKGLLEVISLTIFSVDDKNVLAADPR